MISVYLLLDSNDVAAHCILKVEHLYPLLVGLDIMEQIIGNLDIF